MGCLIGLDRLRDSQFDLLKGKNVGLVCNQGTIGADCVYAFDAFVAAHLYQIFHLGALFGPQHGLFGHTQDNMIEWEGGYREPRSGAHIFSLYGANRKPTPQMLGGLDCLVVDLPDIGARYYTFIWTLFLCMEACEAANIPLIVLDRPNPLGGELVQGTVLDSDYSSFVGLKPLPMRHGRTLGELAQHFHASCFPRLDCTVVDVRGWERSQSQKESGAPWSMPSPNMPTPETALVYPGMCLLEGTNLSEGRGTTHPFEIFGAPFLDGWSLADRLNKSGLTGVTFRPLEFQPTFQKDKGEICKGCFIHVQDPFQFDPCLTGMEILAECWRQSDGKMAWNPPPYEYEYEKLPIDILAGNSWVRPWVEEGDDLKLARDRMAHEIEDFEYLSFADSDPTLARIL